MINENIAAPNVIIDTRIAHRHITTTELDVFDFQHATSNASQPPGRPVKMSD